MRGLLALVMTVGMVAAACSDDDDDGVEAGGASTAPGATSGASDTTASGGATATGGELVDVGTFTGKPPLHIDPALNTTLDAYQVINSLYDGLTELDTQTDPAKPVLKGLVAESFESNADATVWTFKIRQGLTFSDGEPVTPTSFSRAWERASNKDFAGDYSYLMNFIKGGKEKLAGTATTLAGVKADDATMTLTVELAAPYSNFATVAGFQLFFPMPSAVDKLGNQNDWENGVMIGNGPYMMEKARTDTEIVLVKNPKWGGDIYGNKSASLDKITFKVSADPDTAYNSFEAGEGLVAKVPPGRAKEADDNWGTTQNVKTLGTEFYVFNQKDPVVGGPANQLLREAISAAINRDDINTAVFNGIRTIPTGLTPPGTPGFKADLCKYCKYDVAQAQKAFNDWKAAGHSLTAPIKIQFNANSGHEDVVQIIIDDLKQIGIEAQPDPFPADTYFAQLAEGACQFCRDSWNADYPTYDNWMYDLMHTDAIGGNNHGFHSNPQFDSLVDEAKKTVDTDKQASLFQQAEDILLNTDVAVAPINWRVGQYVYNDKKIAEFPQSQLSLVAWDRIKLKA
jgi:ABC-type oligopeptide transport system substrate-binding subunit